MGHAGSTTMASVRCCQEERLSTGWGDELRTGEVDLQDERLCRGTDEAALDRLGKLGAEGERRQRSPPSVPATGAGVQCCEAEAEVGQLPLHPLESLSYTPFRFDEGHTVDVERSHTRYSKIILHSTRARTQKRSKVWGDWLSGATAGRAIMLLTGVAEPHSEQAALCTISAMYYLDRSLTKLSILPRNRAEMPALTIAIDNIQVICAATEFVLLSDQWDAKLNTAEKSRAVLLQYATEDTERRRVCFLEESQAARDDFVQALMALWLERRNDHSMWF